MGCNNYLPSSALSPFYMKKNNIQRTREGWPLLTVENEVTGDSKRLQMKGILPWLVCWACCAFTRDFCLASAALVGPVQNIFPSPYTISFPLPPSPSKLGRQPCWVAFLLICVSVISLAKRPVCPLVSFDIFIYCSDGNMQEPLRVCQSRRQLISLPLQSVTT
jgi:hypothetical protein